MSTITTQQKRYEQELGSLVANYHLRPFRLQDVISMGILGSIAVLSPFFFGVYLSIYAYTHFGNMPAISWSRPWFILTLIALIALLFLIIYRIRLSRFYLAIYDNGIQLKFPRLKSIYWSQIRGISSGTTQVTTLMMTTRSKHRAAIHLDTNNSINLNQSLINLPELITILKSKLYPKLYPSLHSRFHKGDWLDFGSIAVHNEAIRINKITYPWDQVKFFDINSGFFVIGIKNHEETRLSISKIMNPELLLKLVQSEVVP